MSLEETTQKRKRNSSALSYVAVIAHAILSSPHQRLTLSEIYQFIEKQHPRFTENRARWKNTVRHNLSLHDCFVRGEVAINKKGCNWRIHPSFIAEFSRGNFSRHKLSQSPSLPLEIRYERSHGNQLPATTFWFIALSCCWFCCCCTSGLCGSSHDKFDFFGWNGVKSMKSISSLSIAKSRLLPLPFLGDGVFLFFF